LDGGGGEKEDGNDSFTISLPRKKENHLGALVPTRSRKSTAVDFSGSGNKQKKT